MRLRYITAIMLEWPVTIRRRHVAAERTLLAAIDLPAAAANPWSDLRRRPIPRQDSGLAQINKAKEAKLRVAWSYPDRRTDASILNPLIAHERDVVWERTNSIVGSLMTAERNLDATPTTRENTLSTFRASTMGRAEGRTDVVLLERSLLRARRPHRKNHRVFGPTAARFEEGPRSCPAEDEALHPQTRTRFRESLDYRSATNEDKVCAETSAPSSPKGKSLEFHMSANQAR